MKINRRDLFKLTGLSALSLVSGNKILKAFDAKSDKEKGEKRFAMAIDLTKCKRDEGCNQCQNVCHNNHNIPKIKNQKHEIKWIWDEAYVHAFPEKEHGYLTMEQKNSPSMVLCNHCDNPPCVRACPTGATFRRDNGGLVMMDQHRCIGCRFCMAACPYGARSFNFKDPRPHITQINKKYPTRTQGVVEKCTFCAGRVDKGLQPYCVSTCPHGAMSFGDMNDKNSPVRKVLATHNTIRRKPHLGTMPQVFYII